MGVPIFMLGIARNALNGHQINKGDVADVNSSANVAQVLSRSLRTNKDLAQDELLSAYHTAINERQRTELKQQMSAQLTNLDTQTLPMIMDNLREIKLPEEVALLKKAIYISRYRVG